MRWIVWPGLLLAVVGCARAQQWQPPTPRATVGCRPLCDMTADDRYQGEDGGLYGGGHNSPPEAHRQAALAVAQQVRASSQSGRLALLAVGMSNTTQEFSTFLPLARDDATRGAWVVPVDGAQGGADANTWNQSLQPWENLHWRVINAGCRPEQVQVVWLKQALGGPARYGAYPGHADALRAALAQNLSKLRERYPNLRLAYLSSRIYAGWAKTALNPEPYAYESGYAVRRLILDQIGGAAELNWDPAKGAVRAPLLLWGPYLWTDGTTARADGLVWNQSDCRADDGTHPSDSGRRKVADLLLRFCQSDPTAKVWYLR
ncbi:MAG: hypothetical protein IT204_11320 [Fimbriimonadaceae bacterium]|nr:hypothetical protein [Fimbriimonadaceae bacterium]